MPSVNPYFESQMFCSPFTYDVGGTRHRLSAAAKTTTIFLAVILGVASLGILALPVFYISAGAFRHSERRRYLYDFGGFPLPRGQYYNGYPSVSATVYNSDSYSSAYGSPSRRTGSRLRVQRHDSHPARVPAPQYDSHPARVSAPQYEGHLPSQEYGRPAVQNSFAPPSHPGPGISAVSVPSSTPFANLQPPAQANFGFGGGGFPNRGAPARDLRK